MVIGEKKGMALGRREQAKQPIARQVLSGGMSIALVSELRSLNEWSIMATLSRLISSDKRV
ncbi:MAG: hypothetical protein AAF400_00075 [Bacteroidota bacterium]